LPNIEHYVHKYRIIESHAFLKENLQKYAPKFGIYENTSYLYSVKGETE